MSVKITLILLVMASSIALAKSCPTFEIINHTDKWTPKDASTLDVAVTRCKERYGPRGNPCLKVFIKKTEGVYNAVCGPKE